MKKTVYILIISLFASILSGCSFGVINPPEYSETRLLMDTVCTIRAGGDNSDTAVAAAFDRISEIDAAADYYSDSSEVSKINNAAANEEISVSDDIFNILKTALEVSRDSDGAFDITVAPVKDLWNFQSGDHEPPSDAQIQAALSAVGYKKLTLNDESKSVTKADSNVKIDLGGAAKGYASDCVYEVLKSRGIKYAIIDLGGNICVMGKNPSQPDGSWSVGIQKPFSKSGELSQTIRVSETSVVTSGVYQRCFNWNGKLYHHILDPSDGYPSDNGENSASIIYDSALTADCLATACMVLSFDAADSLVQKYNARLIYE